MRGGTLRRLAGLERRCPPPAPSGIDPARQRRWEAVLGRWERLFEQAWPLLTEAEQGQVNGAVARDGRRAVRPVPRLAAAPGRGPVPAPGTAGRGDEGAAAGVAVAARRTAGWSARAAGWSTPGTAPRP